MLASILLSAKEMQNIVAVKFKRKTELNHSYHWGLGKLANLLDLKFMWESVGALLQCRCRQSCDWRTMTNLKMHNNMVYGDICFVFVGGGSRGFSNFYLQDKGIRP